jgi:hypothetical protein
VIKTVDLDSKVENLSESLLLNYLHLERGNDFVSQGSSKLLVRWSLALQPSEKSSTRFFLGAAHHI